MAETKNVIQLKRRDSSSQIDQNSNQSLHKGTVMALMKTLEFKDEYTFKHCTRVAYYALVLGREYGLNAEKLRELELSGLFHDIGKIGIPDRILRKDSGLTEEEYKVMRTHPEISAKIVSQYPGLNKIIHDSVLHHHERYDGRGYPYNLKGDDIPLFSRIILIADTFDAMTSTRPYRAALSSALAYSELFEFSGSQFDPELVKAFIRGMRREEKLGHDTYFLPLFNKTFKKAA